MANLALVSLVAATFVLWAALARRSLLRVARIVLGAAAALFAMLCFRSSQSGFWACLLASMALANMGMALACIQRRER